MAVVSLVNTLTNISLIFHSNLLQEVIIKVELASHEVLLF